MVTVMLVVSRCQKHVTEVVLSLVPGDEGVDVCHLGLDLEWRGKVLPDLLGVMVLADKEGFEQELDVGQYELNQVGEMVLGYQLHGLWMDQQNK